MLTTLLLLGLLSNTADEVRKVKGQATSPEGKAVYTLDQEERWRDGQWVHRKVTGRLNGGQPFFSQVITPGKMAAVPNIQMTYQGSTKQFSVQWEGAHVLMSFRDKEGSSTTNRLESPPENLVGPGGILAAIRKDWSSLLKGETLEWKMIVPPKADAFSVRLVPQKREIVNGREALPVVLEADNWLVRLVAPSTKFWIDVELKSTLKYQGMGASDDEDGKPQEADHHLQSPRASGR